MSAPGKLLRDPLTHFLIAGTLIFLLFRITQGAHPPAPEDERTIIVDRASLVTFMQYRSKAFRPEYFEAELASMSPEAQRNFIDEYVREEALVREARLMGLAEGDYIIRRRMAQKMLYLLDDTAAESFAPDEASLRKYFLDHQSRYEVPASMTFTHVFVDREIRREESALTRARRLKRDLQARNVRFEDAPAYGDRFPYARNYVARTDDFIAGQFGPAFASALEKLEPSAEWQGPLESEYGYHLVLLTERKPAYVPPLAEVVDEVREDFRRDAIAAYREAAIRDLMRRFTVKTDGVTLGTADSPAAAFGSADPALKQGP